MAESCKINCCLFTAVFSLGFSNKIYSIREESIFPIPELQNNHPDSIVYIHFPFRSHVSLSVLLNIGK
jgi:hypothetical protein